MAPREKLVIVKVSADGARTDAGVTFQEDAPFWFTDYGREQIREHNEENPDLQYEFRASEEA
jgi:hypothetical protein